MARSCSSAAAMTSASFTDPPRLDDCAHPGRGRLRPPLPEGEEGIAREHRAPWVVPLLARLVNREKRRIDPAHLAGADPDRRLFAYEHDGVRLDRPHRGPGETQVVPLRIGGPPSGGDLPLGLVRHGRVAEAVLYQESAAYALVIEGLFVAEIGTLTDPQ